MSNTTTDTSFFSELGYFSTAPRVGRFRGFALGIFWGGVTVLVMLLGMLPFIKNGQESLAGFVVPMILQIPFFIIQICICIRRFHDMDWSGWWTLLLFVPIINIIFLVCLYFVPGTQGDNRYGSQQDEPKARSWSLLGIGILFIVIYFVAFIATYPTPSAGTEQASSAINQA